MTRKATLQQRLEPGDSVAGGIELTSDAAQEQGLPAALVADARRGDRQVVLRLIATPPVEGVELFVKSATLAGVAPSEHLRRALEAGYDEALGAFYETLDAGEHESLEALVQRLGPLPPMLAVRAVLQACRGLQAAHEAGAHHGLLSPAALLLDQRGHTIQVDLWGADLALGALGDDERGLATFCAAPERDRGGAASEASDLWSLGAILYFALSGGVAPGKALDRGGNPQHLQDVAPWVEPALAALVHGLLLPEPASRCPSVAALIEALDPFAIGAQLITREMLRPLPGDQRAPLGQRAALPTRWGADEAEHRESLLGQTIAGKYQLARVLGRGGMGVVYEATGPDRQPCAVKLVHEERLSEGDPMTMRRFEREARATQTIQSRHVTRTLAIDLANQPPYIAMELMRGSDMAARLRAAGPIAVTAAARLFAQAAEGLDAAHAAGFIHRDIKPANLFLHETDEGEIITKVCDFGVVKSTLPSNAKSTSTGSLIGSPMYMAPEQITDARAIDGRADVWSLCISLYEALSGTRPWPGGENWAALLVAVCNQEVPPLRQRAPWVPEALAEVVHRGLRRDPARRIASMLELREALLPFAAATPLRWGDLTIAVRPSVKLAAPGHPPASPEASPAASPEASPAASPEASPEASSRARPASGQPEARSQAEPPAPARRVWVGLGLAALAALAALGAVALRQGAPGRPQGAASAAVGAGKRVTVQVPLFTTQALVSVRGSEFRPAPSGVVTLEGEPGDVVAVRVVFGGQPTLYQVRLTEDGKAIPPRLDAPR